MTYMMRLYHCFSALVSVMLDRMVVVVVVVVCELANTAQDENVPMSHVMHLLSIQIQP